MLHRSAAICCVSFVLTLSVLYLRKIIPSAPDHVPLRPSPAPLPQFLPGPFKSGSTSDSSTGKVGKGNDDINDPAEKGNQNDIKPPHANNNDVMTDFTDTNWTAVGDLIVPAGCPWPGGFGNDFIGFRAALLLALLGHRNLVRLYDLCYRVRFGLVCVME